jgi:hypothetical protein
MRERERSLPAAFSLLKSEFNDFLFATIGEEENHASLTVLSALSRQGIDPWRQAARLSRLPREMATQSLTSIIEALPSAGRPKSDSRLIAARLIALLPRGGTRKTTLSLTNAYRRYPRICQILVLLICAGLVAVLLLLISGRS